MSKIGRGFPEKHFPTVSAQDFAWLKREFAHIDGLAQDGSNSIANSLTPSHRYHNDAVVMGTPPLRFSCIKLNYDQ